MKLKVLFGSFIPALLIISCVTEFNADLPYNDLQILVVDGSIIENTDATFYLSKSFYLNANNIPDSIFINDATLFIISSKGYKSPPATPQGRGTYRIPIGALDDDTEYSIEIEYEGNTYRSALSKPIYTQEIDTISWVQSVATGIITFRLSTHGDSHEAKYFLWSYTENWETTANYYTTIFYDPSKDSFYEIDPAPYYYCWKQYDSDQYLLGSTEALSENRIIDQPICQGSSSDSRFRRLYSITVHQRAISKDAYEYYKNINQWNEEMGGLFTPQPSDLGGNITCVTDPSKRVLGHIETIKNTTQKRIFVYPDQISHTLIGNNCGTITNDSIINYIDKYRLTLADVYGWGNRPAGEPDFPRMVPKDWSSAECTDCRSAGGSKNKPDFWPNDHE